MDKIELLHITDNCPILQGLINTSTNVDKYTIVIISRGQVELFTDNKYIELKSNDVLILTPSNIVKIIKILPEIKGFSISLDEEYINPMVLMKNSFYHKHIIKNPRTILSQEALGIMKQFFFLLDSINKALSRHILYKQSITALISSLQLELAGEYIRSRFSNTLTVPNSDYYLFYSFIESVAKNHESVRNVEFYASEKAMERRYFSRKIKEVSGLTPKQWINIEIMDTAKSLLRNSSLSIQQIADNLNYTHASAFAAFFKSQTGITPREYRSSL